LATAQSRSNAFAESAYFMGRTMEAHDAHAADIPSALADEPPRTVEKNAMTTDRRER